MSFTETFNQLDREVDELYHAYARHCKMSDSSLIILGDLFDQSEICTLSSLSSQWGMPMQTVHSSLKSMERKGWIVFESVEGNKKTKQIDLTAKGWAVCAQVISPLKEIERKAASHLPESQKNLLLEGIHDYKSLLHKEMQESGILETDI